MLAKQSLHKVKVNNQCIRVSKGYKDMESLSTAHQINLVINKLTKATLDELSSSGRLSGELSNQLFMTTDENEPGGGGSADILYMSQAQYDALETKDESKYYATPGSGGAASDLSGYAKLSADNQFTGTNTFRSLSANADGSSLATLDGTSLIMNDSDGTSLNVPYETLVADLSVKLYRLGNNMFGNHFPFSLT